MTKALLVIDMQEAAVGNNHEAYFKYDSGLLQRVNKAISETDADMIVYIRNLMKNNIINKLAPVKVFDGTPGAGLAKGLEIVSENIFTKYTGDAFSNESFCSFLRSRDVDTVELVGVDGGGCVALTALGALKNGYRVMIDTDAVGTMFERKKDKYFKKLKRLGAVFK